MSAKQRCCSTCGLPCKGHVGPYGPRCGGGGGGGNTVRRDVTQYGTPTGIHYGLRTTTVQERSCTTCGRPCKGHNGPYGPSCQYGGRINEKEISCTKCGQSCKGHAGPYGPSCQQGPHTERSCTTCGQPCKGHIGPYGPSCQQGLHAVVKERSCSTCGKPCKGHDGPCGPSCQQGPHTERSCSTCGQPCKGHIGPYGPSCQQGLHAVVKERSCSTCGKQCKGHDGPYGPSCQQGPKAAVKERSCTTCGQPCKGHIGPYGPSCQQGRYNDTKERCCTTCGTPCKGHDGPYGPSCQQGLHAVVKDRSCSTCGKPCRGHDGPYGPTCNMGQSWDDLFLRPDNAGAAPDLSMNLDLLGPIPSASASRVPSKDCHNVITLNMGGPAISTKRKETVRKIMDKASPGIAFFQEVICPVRDEWLNDLLDRYQWVNTGDNIQAGVMWDTDIFKQRMTFDAAAKQRILERAAFSRKYDVGLISDIATRACVVYLQPTNSGTNSGVMCVSWHGPNVGDVDSRCEIWRALQDFSLQARRLVQMRTGQTQVPIIIAGDFNLPLEVASDSRQLSDKLSLSQYQQSKRRTEHKKKNIDYFAYTEDLKLLDVKPDVKNDPEETLDHDPITASLIIVTDKVTDMPDYLSLSDRSIHPGSSWM